MELFLSSTQGRKQDYKREAKQPVRREWMHKRVGEVQAAGGARARRREVTAEKEGEGVQCGRTEGGREGRFLKVKCLEGS